MRSHNEVLFKVNKRGPAWNGSPCWEWQGGTSHGYGYLYIQRKKMLVHRYMWEYYRGPVPEGLQIDHKCLNKACCNPAHLQPVTALQNNLRGVESRKFSIPDLQKGAHVEAGDERIFYCKRGHVLDDENLVITSNGKRRCRQCHNAEEVTYHAEKQHSLTADEKATKRALQRENLQRWRESKRIAEGRPSLAHPSERTHCPYGHLYDERNTMVRPDGRRRCRACHNLTANRRRAISS